MTTAPLPEHGTTARYRRRCRCELCRAASAAYAMSRRTPEQVARDTVRRREARRAAATIDATYCACGRRLSTLNPNPRCWPCQAAIAVGITQY